MGRPAAALLLAVLLCSTAAAQAMYSWTDKRGVVHYTDDPSAIPKDAQPRAKRTSGARIESVKNDAARTRSQAGSASGSARASSFEPAPAAAPRPQTQSAPSPGPSPEQIRLENSIRKGERAKANAQPSVNPGSCHTGNCRADGYTWTSDMEERLKSEKAQLEKPQAGHR